MPDGSTTSNQRPVAEKRRRSVRAIVDDGTRERVVRAAIECIRDEGYYRASSNRIAERAEVTWGVIQHHFGTRDGLLIAVARRSADQLVDLAEHAVIQGESVEERLTSFADVMWKHFRRPEYLVSVQIMLNLSRDPKVQAETAATTADLNRRLAGTWPSLLVAAIGPEHAGSPVGQAVMQSLRGLAIALELSDAFRGRSAKRSNPDTSRAELIRAFACLIGESTANKQAARKPVSRRGA